MDRYDQRKITRNLVVVKERVEGDLDYIIDRLIERDVLTIQSKVVLLWQGYKHFNMLKT